MSAVLRLEQVSLRRGGRLLFDGLDLELGAGGAVLLTGPNGSGKSSLIRLAAGLLEPLSGRIHRSSLALADDFHALDPELELRQALGFWLRLGGAGGGIEDTLSALGLAELDAIPVRLLSAGQRRRAALARVAASGARLWLLDEPLNALDRRAIAHLDRAIDAHRSAGGAVLAASHLALAGEWERLELGEREAA